MSGFLSPDARLRMLSDLGLVSAGAKCNVYVAGTPATRIDTFNNVDCLAGHENANPIVASAGGLFGPIYLKKGLAYKYVVTDANDVAIWTQDNISVPPANTLAAGTGISLNTVGDTTTITATGLTVASVDINDFRLTFESGVPVSSTDQLAKTIVYATPSGRGSRIDLFDAAGTPTTYTSGEFSTTLPAVANQAYDIFAYVSGGVPTLELLAWTSDTARATAVIIGGAGLGVWVKSGDLSRRYLGSVRTTAVAGQSESSKAKRYLDNAYNQTLLELARLETTASWAYNTPTIRQANGAVANQVEVMIGLPGRALMLAIRALVSNNGGGAVHASVGIGYDSTTGILAPSLAQTDLTATFLTPLTGIVVHTPAIGRHFYSWNEYSVNSGVTTWYGVDPTFGGSYYGITGQVLM